MGMAGEGGNGNGDEAYDAGAEIGHGRGRRAPEPSSEEIKRRLIASLKVRGLGNVNPNDAYSIDKAFDAVTENVDEYKTGERLWSHLEYVRKVTGAGRPGGTYLLHELGESIEDKQDMVRKWKRRLESSLRSLLKIRRYDPEELEIVLDQEDVHDDHHAPPQDYDTITPGETVAPEQPYKQPLTDHYEQPVAVPRDESLVDPANSAKYLEWAREWYEEVHEAVHQIQMTGTSIIHGGPTKRVQWLGSPLKRFGFDFLLLSPAEERGLAQRRLDKARAAIDNLKARLTREDLRELRHHHQSHLHP